MKKYSKSLLDIAAIKQSFLADNGTHLANALQINNVYTQQPRRMQCKTCMAPIGKDKDFSSHGVDYCICDVCGHLNGMFEDTREFCEYLYSSDGGSRYSSSYLTDYHARVQQIYLPKVDFLLASLEELCQESKDAISISDFGCGGGHFVHAATLRGLAARGYDISTQLVDLANYAYNAAFPMRHTSEIPFCRTGDEQQLCSILANSKSLVASFIGVLEHLRNPLEFLDAFCSSKVKYLYISVPLFSLTVFFESIFEAVFPRLLSGGHTHLYTHASLAYLLNKYSLHEVSSWHFGTDAMDLRRSMLISMDNNGVSDRFKELFFDEYFSPQVMDQMQRVIDLSCSASEIHMVISKG